MSKSDLFLRLPYIWRKLDTQGVLERFLSVVDGDFDRIDDLVTALLDVRSVEKIDDFYLYLLSHITGHSWRHELTRKWNRGGIRNAITIHSYKGTLARFHDMVVRNGGSYWKHVDMASQIVVPGSQGFLGGYSSYLMGPVYYHPGAHRFYVDEEVRNTDFETDVQLIRPVGEVWFLIYVYSVSTVFQTYTTVNAPSVLRNVITYSYNSSNYLGMGKLGSYWLDPYDGLCIMEHEVVT